MFATAKLHVILLVVYLDVWPVTVRRNMHLSTEHLGSVIRLPARLLASAVMNICCL